MTTVAQFLNSARTQLGGYYPGDSPYGLWYSRETGLPGYGPQPFCAMGLSWAADRIGAQDIIPPFAYTPSGYAWYKARGQTIGRLADARPGDLIFYDFGLGRISHVAVVETNHGDGTTTNIEYNTSGSVGGNQRNGRVVARKRRGTTYVAGIARPRYSASPTPTPAPPVVLPEEIDMSSLVRIRRADGAIFLASTDPAHPIFRGLDPEQNLDYDRLGVPLPKQSESLSTYEIDRCRQRVRDLPAVAREGIVS